MRFLRKFDDTDSYIIEVHLEESTERAKQYPYRYTHDKNGRLNEKCTLLKCWKGSDYVKVQFADGTVLRCRRVAIRIEHIEKAS